LPVRIRKILAVTIFGMVAAFVISNLWLDSQENQKAYYATSADAERDRIASADVFDRGWLPVVLKSGASEIREEHNVSTNRGRATFRYTLLFVDEVERSCSPLTEGAPVISPFPRWPAFLRNGDTAEKLHSRGIKILKCGDFTVAINDEQSGFFWH
jgi:hypothetical protein